VKGRPGLARFASAAPLARSRLFLAIASACLLVLGEGPGALAPSAVFAQQDDSDASSSQAAAVAIAPSVYWGSYIEGWPGDPAVLDAFEQTTGKGESIIAWGESWYHRNQYQGFPQPYADIVRSRGSIPLISWASWDQCCGSEQPHFTLASIIRGDHDQYIVNWASAAKAWGHPFFLVLDSEMNGWWWPWSEQANTNNPGQFVAAWRHVVDTFRKVGANNATWVWCPNIVEPMATPIEELYPGDNYVDWTCMDGYNWGLVRGKWQDPAQVFGASDYRGESGTFNSNTYELLRQIAPTKPVMIGETSAPEIPGSKADWITDAYTQTLPNLMPAIRAVIWFGWVDKELNYNWAVDSSPEAQTAFANAIALPRYATNIYQNITNMPINPPDGPFVGG
jgi:mannan endo-1,4-beta-mannosidase